MIQKLNQYLKIERQQRNERLPLHAYESGVITLKTDYDDRVIMFVHDIYAPSRGNIIYIRILVRPVPLKLYP